MFERKFKISGMRCANCASLVTSTVEKIISVEDVFVNFLTGIMIVKGDVDYSEIIKSVTSLGYKCELYDEEKAKKEKENIDNEKNKVLKKMALSIALFVFLFYLSLGRGMFSFPLPIFLKEEYKITALLQFLFSLSIMMINFSFFKSGIKGVINKSPNMDTLVSLGSFSSFAYSLYYLIKMFTDSSFNTLDVLNLLYFDTSSMILIFISIGKYLEALSKKKTTSSLDSLFSLRPKKVTVIEGDKEIIKDIDDVKYGDVIIVKAGEIIGCDGVVIDGASFVDEASLTGESIPKEKIVGSRVYSGTINKNGFLKCKALSAAKYSSIEQIIDMVSSSATTKAPISKIADKVAAFFVPLVILTSIIVFSYWLITTSDFRFSLERGVSVLVVACPCALGLGAPCAVMVASGMGAKRGVLYKDATAIENLGKIKGVCFDKTGTLTKGNMKVKRVISLSSLKESEIVCKVLALEKATSHPLAYSIVQYAKENNIKEEKVENYQYIPGLGARGEIDNEKYFVGGKKYISFRKNFPENEIKKLENVKDLENSIIILYGTDTVLGLIELVDEIKDESYDVVKTLKKMGLKTTLLTGDNKITALRVKEKLNLDYCYYDYLPLMKKDKIIEMNKKEMTVMVGDGLNDTLALKESNVSVSIGPIDVCHTSASISIITGSLKSLIDAIKISKKTIKIIYENLFWALFYNLITILLAAGFFYNSFNIVFSPVISSIVMCLSSIFIVFNALRINNIKFKGEEKMKIEFKVEKMMCPHCEKRVEDALIKFPFVEKVKANHKKNNVTIYLKEEGNKLDLIKAIENEGYKVIS